MKIITMVWAVSYGRWGCHCLFWPLPADLGMRLLANCSAAAALMCTL